MNDHFEIKLPKFLLAEEPTEPNDRDIYIYSPHYLSLVLVIPEDEKPVLLNEETRKKPRKTFTYEDETFELVIIQNNVEMTGGNLAPEITEIEFLKQAYDWYKDYLIWEDKNINEDINSKLN